MKKTFLSLLCLWVLLPVLHAQVTAKDFGTINTMYTSTTVYYTVEITSPINPGAVVYLIPAGGSPSTGYYQSWTLSSGAPHLESSPAYTYTGAPSTIFTYQVYISYNGGAGFWRSTTQSAPLLVCTSPTLFQPQVVNATAALSWSAPVTGGSTQFTIQYKPTSSATWTTVGPLGGSAFTTPMLTAGDYNWRVNSSCIMSAQPFAQYTHGYKDGAVFRIPSTPPVNLVAQMQNNTTYNVVSLSWGVGPGFNPNYYELQFRQRNTTAWTTVQVTGLNYVSPALVSGVFYEWQVRSVTNANGGTYTSNWIRGYDFYSSACRMKTATVSGAGNNHITIDWTTYTDNMGMNAPAQYEIHLYNHATGAFVNAYTFIPQVTNSYTIGGLPGETPYRAYMRVYCQSGTVSEWIAVTDPAYPATMAADLYGSNSVVFTLCNTCNGGFDAGNTFATATYYDFHSTVYDRIQNAGDVDWFKFNAPPYTANIFVVLQRNFGPPFYGNTYPCTATGDYDIHLYNSAQTLLQSSTNTNTPEVIDRNITATNATKTFYLKVVKKASAPFDARRCYFFWTQLKNSGGGILRSAGGNVTEAAITPAWEQMPRPGKLKLAPVPAQQTVTVYYTAASTGKTIIGIYDVMGRSLKTLQLVSNEGPNSYEVNTAGLPNGTYWVKLQSGSTIATEKLVIQH